MGTRAGNRARAAFTLLGALIALGTGAPTASAAPPGVGAVWAADVSAHTARLHGEVDPKGLTTTYRFDYITTAAHNSNVSAGKDPFAGALRQPASGEGKVSGTAPTPVSSTLFGLAPATAYRYRLVVKNVNGTTTGPTRELVTYPVSESRLPDGRGWEMVSPVDKNGGGVAAAGSLMGGGLLQAAAQGDAATYSSVASFGAGAQGAGAAGQYLARRTPAGWLTENITPAASAGSYGTEPGGVPYRLFSPDLGRALMLNGRPCRGGGGGCPVANPPLAGTDAPVGYQNYYLRDSSSGAFEALLGVSDVAGLDTDPAEFALTLSGTSPDLRHTVLSTCAALTSGASEVPLGAGCDPSQPNLYEWSGGILRLINTTPGASLGAQSGAVSEDGNRVYWTDLASEELWLREGSTSRQVDAGVGGGGSFEAASLDGAVALFTKEGHLHRYTASTDSSTDLTPSGGVLGVLGASSTASRVYYVTGSGLFLRDGASMTKVAAAADADNYPPATGTARVSADGTKLLFVSTAALATSDGATFDNTDLLTGTPDRQVYLYDAVADDLTCISCNPSRGRPIGPSSIPGAVANGSTPDSTQAYKPRVLAADGRRVFFDSEDALVLADVNRDSDVYQWEAQGSGSCARAAGCVALISSGQSGHAEFVDASAEGADTFFLTDRSLVGADPGAVDLYDARIGGGFSEPSGPAPCNGDACQIVPGPVEDPVLTTLLSGPGNPAERYFDYQRKAKRKCLKGKRAKGRKCVKKGKRAKRGGRR